MKRFLCVLAIFVYIGCSQNAVKEDSNNNDNVSKNSEKVVQEEKPNIEVRNGKDEISQDEVISVFKKLTLRITDKHNNKSFEIVAPMGKKINIDNTSLAVEILEYYPDFVMGEDRGVVTKSLDERNPAAKVNIYKEEKIIFKGWLFAKFPDIHAFEDSDYDVKLVSSAKAEK
jgi:hypothetical protein